MRKTIFLSLVLALGCETGPSATDAGTDSGLDAGTSDAGTSDAGFDAGIAPPACEPPPSDPPMPVCTPLATDFVTTDTTGDGWPTCISDDGQFHAFFTDIGSNARVMAYEAIQALLFDPTSDATSQEFLDARLLYQEAEGLDSRMVRRYDPHYTAPVGTDCTLPGTPETYPDYCVGPARLQPAILAAFMGGIDGTGNPRVHAATIQAAILWFLAISTYKEGLTCTDVIADCDSAYGYYTGGEPARGGLGLAEEINDVDPLAHDRAWDGLLAVRCWRDIDTAVPAADPVMRDQARDQYDRAVTDGVAAIIRDRFVRLCTADTGELEYYWAFLQTLGPLLDREATERNPAMATALREELARASVGDVDVVRATDAIDAIFDCP